LVTAAGAKLGVEDPAQCPAELGAEQSVNQSTVRELGLGQVLQDVLVQLGGDRPGLLISGPAGLEGVELAPSAIGIPVLDGVHQVHQAPISVPGTSHGRLVLGTGAGRRRPREQQLPYPAGRRQQGTERGNCVPAVHGRPGSALNLSGGGGGPEDRRGIETLAPT
jgi:hypothetical protein